MSAPVCRPECGTTYGGSGETQWASTALLWCSAACAKAKRPLNPAGASEPATRPLSERMTVYAGALEQNGPSDRWWAREIREHAKNVAALEAELAEAKHFLSCDKMIREELQDAVCAARAEAEALRKELAEVSREATAHRKALQDIATAVDPVGGDDTTTKDIMAAIRAGAEAMTELADVKRESMVSRNFANVHLIERNAARAEVETLRAKLVEQKGHWDREKENHERTWNRAKRERDEATARVRAIKKACANAGYLEATRYHSTPRDAGAAVAAAISALPDDAVTALRTCGKAVPGGRNCGDTTVATGRPITIICGRCRVGRPPLPDDAGVATVAEDDLPTESDGAETVKRLGIDVPAWAAEIREKVAKVTGHAVPPAAAPCPCSGRCEVAHGHDRDVDHAHGGADNRAAHTWPVAGGEGLPFVPWSKEAELKESWRAATVADGEAAKLLDLDEYEAVNLRAGLEVLKRINCDTGDWLGQIMFRIPDKGAVCPNQTVESQVAHASRILSTDAIAAAVTAAYNRAADAFEKWSKWREGAYGPLEIKAWLRAGCPAPGEAKR